MGLFAAFRRQPQPDRNATATEPPGDRARSWRTDALHVFVLSSFAFSGPMLDLLARRNLFLAHKTFAALVGVVGVLCLVIPAAIVLIEVCWNYLIPAGWGSRARSAFHAAFVACAFAVLALQTFDRVRGLPGMVALPFAFVTGCLAVGVYFRSALWRKVVTVASPGILLFPATFLYHVSGTQAAPKISLPEISVRNPVPIVFVCFDEFCGVSLMDADRGIDAARYPNFHALAQESTWYRNATSVHARTDHAVPAILTGTRPPPENLPTAAEHPQNLFTALLASRQYELSVFEPFTKLFPAQSSEDFILDEGVGEQIISTLRVLGLVYLHHLLPADLPVERPEIPRAWHGLRETWRVDRKQRTGVIRYSWDSDRDAQFEHFLECLSNSERPMLNFGHFALPHYPWYYLPSGHKYHDDNGANHPDALVKGAYGELGELWGSDDLVVTQNYERYLLQVGYADRLIGRLVERLKSIGLYDRCLFVVVGDHGVSFRANLSRRIPESSNLADIMSVPLFIKLPNQHSGAISDRNVESIDIFPTIAALLEMTLPLPVEGTSVLDDQTAERPEKTFDSEGKIVTCDATFEAKYQTLQDMLARFGTGANPERLFRNGPHPELIGRRLDDLDVQADSEVRLHRKWPTSFRVDAASDIVPCYVEGDALVNAADPRLPLELALAVNGTIHAVTRTYALSDLKRTWSAIIPESALEPGDNDFRVFVVSASGDRLTLHRCALVDKDDSKN